MDIFNLTDLTLDELSIVDRPANQGAMVTMFKRDNKEQDMTVDNEAIKALKDRNEVLQKALIDNGFVITAEGITKSDTKVDYLEVNGDKVNKADLPDSVVKALEDAKVEKEAMSIEKADMALTKKAEETLPHLDVKHAKRLLKMADTDEEFMSFLAAIDAMFGKSMDEIGKSAKDGDMGSATEALEKRLTDIMTTKSLTGPVGRAKAYQELASTKDGAALITKATKE